MFFCWVDWSGVNPHRRSELHLNWLTWSNWKLEEKKEPVKKRAVLQLLSLRWLIEVSTALWKWDVSLLNIILIRLGSRTHKQPVGTTYAVCDHCRAYSYHICKQMLTWICTQTSITVNRTQIQTPQMRLRSTVNVLHLIRFNCGNVFPHAYFIQILLFLWWGWWFRWIWFLRASLVFLDSSSYLPWSKAPRSCSNFVVYCHLVDICCPSRTPAWSIRVWGWRHICGLKWRMSWKACLI